jgi:hypothetical protein
LSPQGLESQLAWVMHVLNATQSAFALHAVSAVVLHCVAFCKHVSQASPGVGSWPAHALAAHCVAQVPGVWQTHESNACSPTSAPAWCWL